MFIFRSKWSNRRFTYGDEAGVDVICIMFTLHIQLHSAPVDCDNNANVDN